MNNKSEDRGMMKWAPFYSVMSESEIKSSVDKKVINEKPEFSEDQILEMENDILFAFNSNKKVSIKIYDKYNDVYIKGYISKIDPYTKTISINKNKVIFNDIVNISIIEV